jgi:hypothetical protein
LQGPITQPNLRLGRTTAVALRREVGRHLLEGGDERAQSSVAWATESVHSSSRPGVMKTPRFML